MRLWFVLCRCNISRRRITRGFQDSAVMAKVASSSQAVPGVPAIQKGSSKLSVAIDVCL